MASIATVGFGGLAALTYSGTSDAANAADTTSQNVAGSTTDATTDTDTTTSATDSVTSGLQATPAPTATTKHKARVTSGGSGG